MAGGEINRATVSQLVQAVAEAKKYAFLIGAGTSRPKPAEIPTGGELIDIWRQECYKLVDPNEEIDEWIATKEKTLADDQTEYGFWFEERHPTRGQRRKRIQELVEDAEPTLGHILLATMMNEGYVPNALTPNFDDLLFDAFYLFLEDKPHLVDHQAIAPEFKLTRERPAIIKLHGDYLYDNLQNTTEETKALEPAMEDALRQTVTEYGLVVIGYSGTDDSIMDPLLEADLSEYGVYWCKRTPDDLTPKVEELLKKPNTYLVEIEGFTDLMIKFGRQLNGVEPPEPGDLIGRARDRAYMLAGALEEGEKISSTELRLRLDGMQQKIGEAQRAMHEENYQEAISAWDKYLEREPEHAWAYHIRGVAKVRLKMYETAMEDFTQAIELDPEDKAAFMARAEVGILLCDLEQARQDASRARSLHQTTKHSAASLLLGLISKILLGEDIEEEEEREYRRLCNEEFTTRWNFLVLDSWLWTVDIEQDKRETIRELVDLLQEHWKESSY